MTYDSGATRYFSETMLCLKILLSFSIFLFSRNLYYCIETGLNGET